MLEFVHPVQNLLISTVLSSSSSENKCASKSKKKKERTGMFTTLEYCCSACSQVLELETDVFTPPPPPRENNNNSGRPASRLSVVEQRVALGACNMSF
mmetsp:Transcript_20917/g.27501  ORF Transcript_20917/g.27501 Transcript_20917/m.27501 type:complete len:98 (+) Transcript_20917:973-1266(+)